MRARRTAVSAAAIVLALAAVASAQYGGWGREHKFPHVEAIDFALIRW